MKHLIIILFIALGAVTAHAQQAPAKPKPVLIMLPDSSNLIQLQQILQFSYQALVKTDLPANQVNQAQTVIQQLFPLLVPMKKDSLVKVTPTVVAKKAPVKKRQ